MQLNDYPHLQSLGTARRRALACFRGQLGLQVGNLRPKLADDAAAVAAARWRRGLRLCRRQASRQRSGLCLLCLQRSALRVELRRQGSHLRSAPKSYGIHSRRRKAGGQDKRCCCHLYSRHRRPQHPILARSNAAQLQILHDKPCCGMLACAVSGATAAARSAASFCAAASAACAASRASGAAFADTRACRDATCACGAKERPNGVRKLQQGN